MGLIFLYEYIINICLSGESGARNEGWPDVAQEKEEWSAHLSADQEYASQEYLRPPEAQEYESQECLSPLPNKKYARNI